MDFQVTGEIKNVESPVMFNDTEQDYDRISIYQASSNELIKLTSNKNALKKFKEKVNTEVTFKVKQSMNTSKNGKQYLSNRIA